LIFDIYQSFGSRVGDNGNLKLFNNGFKIVDCNPSEQEWNDLLLRVNYV
jgi:hypothetical protein